MKAKFSWLYYRYHSLDGISHDVPAIDGQRRVFGDDSNGVIVTPRIS